MIPDLSAALMRCGVAGISSIEMPNGESASLTALRIAAGAPIVPPSPRPLAPVRDDAAGVSMWCSSIAGISRDADFDTGFAKAHRHIQVAARSRRQNAAPLGAVDYDIADIVDARRIGRHRIARVDDRRRFGDFDFDAIRHVFRFRDGRCKHRGNGLADKTHDVMGRIGCSIGR